MLATAGLSVIGGAAAERGFRKGLAGAASQGFGLAAACFARPAYTSGNSFEASAA